MKPTCLIAVLALFAAMPAAAQDRQDPRSEATVRLGPLYAKPTLALKDFGVDTNVFNTSGEQESDFTFTLTPRATVWVPFARRATLRADTSADFVWYQQFDTERSINPAVALRGEIYLRRLTLFGVTSYLRSRQRPNFEIDLRGLRTEQINEMGFEIFPVPKFGIEVAGRRFTTEFARDAVEQGRRLQDALNHESRSLIATARYRLTPLTSLAVRGEAIEDRFPFSPVRDSDSVRVMPGIEFKPRALVSGSAFVGVRRLKPLDARMPDYRGTVAQLALSYTLLGSTSFGVTADRDVAYSYEPLQPYYLATSVGASVRRHLTGRFDVIADARRIKYSYRSVVGALDPSVLAREDVARVYGGSLGYRLGRGTRIGFGVTYLDRESNTILLRNFDGFRIGTTVTYGTN